jgi:hypothetical protein
VIYIRDLYFGLEPSVRKLIEIRSLVSEMEHAARLAVPTVCALWTYLWSSMKTVDLWTVVHAYQHSGSV